jgi:hypothetical protein
VGYEEEYLAFAWGQRVEQWGRVYGDGRASGLPVHDGT